MGADEMAQWGKVSAAKLYGPSWIPRPQVVEGDS